jgi:hypothetical protein
MTRDLISVDFDPGETKHATDWRFVIDPVPVKAQNPIKIVRMSPPQS